MLQAYPLSALRAQYLSSPLEVFVAAFPEPWLVQEAGPTMPAGSTKTGLMPAIVDDRLPLGADQVLATHLGASPPLDEITLGREEPAIIRINDTTLSRVHLVFRRAGARWTVEDPSSSNGSWLNSRRLPLKQSQPLADRMRLQAGQVFLTFYEAPGMLERVRTLTP